MAKPSKPSKQTKQKIDHEQLGKMLVNIYETGYIDRNQAYKMSFVKGLLAGFGGVIGATLVVALVLWMLSFFQEIPLVDRVYDNLQSQVQTQQQQ
jgi:hypothetical protein